MDISLDNFQGPMDLLLHLIKKKEMNIIDIKIEIIIDEYLNYINNMKKINLNIASEYLVMSSELLEIKSKILLVNDLEVEDDEVNELKENLINRISEYQKYKEIIPTLKEYELERLNYKTKSPSNILEYKTDIKYESNLNVNTLVDAYKKFLKRIKEDGPISTKVTKKEISIESRILSIKEKLKLNKRVCFDDLFDEVNKPYIVATFLAVLEMVKFGDIVIHQDSCFGTILCEKIN